MDLSKLRDCYTIHHCTSCATRMVVFRNLRIILKRFELKSMQQVFDISFEIEECQSARRLVHSRCNRTSRGAQANLFGFFRRALLHLKNISRLKQPNRSEEHTSELQS